MGSLAERLGEDLKDAIRSSDAVRRDEIRGLLAALHAERQARLTRELDRRGLILRDETASLSEAQQAEVERLRASFTLSDDDEQAILQQRVKQHGQSIEAFRKGGRADLLATEEAQLEVLRRYLPQQAAEDEVEAAVRAAVAETGASGPRDQGRVMALLSQRLRGRADMRALSARVQAILAGGA